MAVLNYERFNASMDRVVETLHLNVTVTVQAGWFMSLAPSAPIAEGATTAVQLRPRSRPSVPLSVQFASSAPTLVVPSYASTAVSLTPNSVATFGASNWTSAVSFSLVSAQDVVPDGDRVCFFNSTLRSSDPSGFGAPIIEVLIVDDDKAELNFSATSVTVLEAGTTSSQLNVTLLSPPQSDVVVYVPTGFTDIVVSPSTLVFGPGNWSTPQLLTVQAVEDNYVEGTDTIAVTFTTAASADIRYRSFSESSFTVFVTDNDVDFVSFSPTYAYSDGGTIFTVQASSNVTFLAGSTIPTMRCRFSDEFEGNERYASAAVIGPTSLRCTVPACLVVNFACQETFLSIEANSQVGTRRLPVSYYTPLSLNRIVPSTGKVQDVTPFILTTLVLRSNSLDGVGFVDAPEIACTVDGVKQPATIVENALTTEDDEGTTMMQCQAPVRLDFGGPDDVTVEVAATLDGQILSDTVLEFTYSDSAFEARRAFWLYFIISVTMLALICVLCVVLDICRPKSIVETVEVAEDEVPEGPEALMGLLEEEEEELQSFAQQRKAMALLGEKKKDYRQRRMERRATKRRVQMIEMQPKS